jgi:hypothetical protein
VSLADVHEVSVADFCPVFLSANTIDKFPESLQLAATTALQTAEVAEVHAWAPMASTTPVVAFLHCALLTAVQLASVADLIPVFPSAKAAESLLDPLQLVAALAAHTAESLEVHAFEPMASSTPVVAFLH